MAGHTQVHKGFDGPAALAQASRTFNCFDGCLVLLPAHLSILLEGIDWRMQMLTHAPELMGTQS